MYDHGVRSREAEPAPRDRVRFIQFQETQITGFAGCTVFHQSAPAGRRIAPPPPREGHVPAIVKSGRSCLRSRFAVQTE